MSSILVCGTSSDAGKSTFVAALCRCLRERGLSVSPFKAQNMSLNSYVTSDGGEIGRAQAAQAFSAGLEPEVEMNPVLIKPTTDTGAQVIVMGHPQADTDARGYDDLKRSLLPIVLSAFGGLQERFDVVVCEGAGSLAEFNLRERDVVNLGFARATETPIVVLADIDRGGSFAGLYGSVGLLSPPDQALVCGFILNKFRGDRGLLTDGLQRFSRLTGRPFYGVIPWMRDLFIDAEDSLAVDTLAAAGSRSGADPLHVAVVRLRSMSNFTDFEPLALEPDVLLRFTESPVEVAEAHVAILPGSKATVADMSSLRERGLDHALRARAAAGKTVLGICGGYQMLGKRVVDSVESHAGEVPGLDLLPVETVFRPDKLLTRREGECVSLGQGASGYEIRHGRVRRFGGEPMFVTEDGEEGCVQGRVWGTSWHGLFESDAFRKSFLSSVAEHAGIGWEPGDASFSSARERQAERLGNILEVNVDVDGLLQLIERGPSRDLPLLAPGGIP